MKSKVHSFSYLMELIIVIFFFVISATVCVSLVVKAKEKQQAANDLGNTMLEAQSMIETMQAFPTVSPEQLFDVVKIDDHTYRKENLVIEWNQEEIIHGTVNIYHQEELVSQFPFVLGGKAHEER